MQLGEGRGGEGKDRVAGKSKGVRCNTYYPYYCYCYSSHLAENAGRINDGVGHVERWRDDALSQLIASLVAATAISPIYI